MTPKDPKSIFLDSEAVGTLFKLYYMEEQTKKYFFSSDYHFSHHNILKYDNRDFKDIEHMGAVIVDRHNSVVGPDDDFYFLGDFCFNIRHAERYLQSLNGNLFFIKGNHDGPKMVNLYQKYGTYLGQQADIVINKRHIVLNHFSLRVWNRNHHASWHLYGHSHMNLEHLPNGKSMDVCIIGNDYYPYEFEDIKKILDKRDKVCPDHHK